MCEDDGMMNEYENSEMEHYGEKTGQLKEEPLDDFSDNRTEFGHINEEEDDDSLSDFGHIVKESQNTKKNLLMDEEDDEEEQDEDDFDGSMDKLLNFDDEQGDEDEEEERATDEDDQDIPSEEPVVDDEIEGVDSVSLAAKLEDLINDILDKREQSGQSQYKEIPTGQANQSLNDFGTQGDLPPATPETNKTPTSELLSSEFPQNQGKIDIIKDRLDSEVTYQDYLNGETDKSVGDDAASMMDVDSEPETEIPDMFSARSDDFEDEAGETAFDDDDFERNSELTGGMPDEEEEMIMDSADYGVEDNIEPVNPEPVESQTPTTSTINVGGQPIKIVLTGMVITEAEVKALVSEARTKNLKLYKLEGVKDSLDIFVECNNKKYKIHYDDVPKARGKMPFSIKMEKYNSLNEAFDRISGINRKSIMEQINFKKMVTKDVIAREKDNNFKESTMFEGMKDIRDVKGWNVKALGNVSLKTGINEVLSNITGAGQSKNTLVKTNEGQFFLIKGSLNEKSPVGMRKQLVDMEGKREYGTAQVVGIFENSMKGLGQIMEKIQRTSVPLLIWK
jgi:hypothetical protein